MLKMIGAVLIVASCGFVGFGISRNHKQTIFELEQMLVALDYMQMELQYQKTPLPALCRRTAEHISGKISRVLLSFAQELDKQVSPDPAICMEATLERYCENWVEMKPLLIHLGKVLGKFDLEGQKKGIAAVHSEAKVKFDTLSINKDSRVRGYQTLGLCAGAAVAILLL